MFPMQITITVNTPADFAKFVAFTGGKVIQAEAAAANEKPKGTTATEAAKETKSTGETKNADTSAKSDAKQLSPREQAKDITMKCVRGGKRPQIEDVLRKYHGLAAGAKLKIPGHTAADLPEEKLADFIAEALKVLG